MTRRCLPGVLAILAIATLGASNPNVPRLVAIPGGEFAPPSLPSGLSIEIDPFELAETPVTWAQYKRFARGTSHWTPLLAQHEAEFPPDAPVVYVTWDDADAYCRSLALRLPTEVEWEYAAASGVHRLPTTYTPEEAAELRWYGGAKKAPHPVRQDKPNGLGLYDMHGNVWEWVAEVQGTFTRKDGREQTSGQESLGCGQFRGDDGSYAWYLRSAVRSAAQRDHATRYRGFRCAR